MSIKIFISNRIDIDSYAPGGNCFVPVRCGAVFDKNTNTDIIGDNTGDNISEKQPSYSELTVQYWSWKNVDADYYGLCHYRRFLNFSDKKCQTDLYKNIIEETIDEKTIKKYCLSDDKVEALVSKYDIVSSEKIDVSKFPEKFKSIRDHYAKADVLYEKDLDAMLETIKDLSPDYYDTAVKYLSGKTAYFCNMFVMKKEIFFSYCEWLFKILDATCEKLDMSFYSKQSLRTPGHLAERLFGIWLTYQKEHHTDWKYHELQTVLFRNPLAASRDAIVHSSFENSNAIPLVFASNDAFAPVCAVAIKSVLMSSDPNRNYDIIILHKDIVIQTQYWIRKCLEEFNNAHITFYNTTSIIERYDLRPSNHITIETYYRFLIPDILPDYDKVLYLDCDLICRDDISKLYDTDLGDKWIGATLDPDMQGQLSLNKNTRKYVVDVLNLKNPYEYFQAGVLLLNTKELRKQYRTEQWLKFASQPYRYGDQDILNKYCQGHVLNLELKWNLLIDCENFRVPVLIEASPNALRLEYHKARKNPSIIHYAGFQKPWNTPNCDLYPYFWEIARTTLFYEYLIGSMSNNKSNNLPSPKKKSKLVLFCKKHCPHFLYRFAKKVQRVLHIR